jgi:hypothetical protein
MKKLLHKEFCFTALPLTYIFLMFALMTLIPGYPILVGSFFVSLGIFQTFQSAREQNDILYTVLMPVSKKDAAIARYLFVICIQLLYLLLSALLTFICMTVLKNASPYLSNPMMNANPAYLGYILLAFALFNGIFVNGYWKTAYNIGRPFLYYSICAFILVAIAETLHHIPGLTFLNTANEGLGIQYAVLIAAACIYGAVTYLSMKKSCRSFEIIDL